MPNDAPPLSLADDGTTRASTRNCGVGNCGHVPPWSGLWRRCDQANHFHDHKFGTKAFNLCAAVPRAPPRREGGGAGAEGPGSSLADPTPTPHPTRLGDSPRGRCVGHTRTLRGVRGWRRWAAVALPAAGGRQADLSAGCRPTVCRCGRRRPLRRLAARWGELTHPPPAGCWLASVLLGRWGGVSPCPSSPRASPLFFFSLVPVRFPFFFLFSLFPGGVSPPHPHPHPSPCLLPFPFPCPWTGPLRRRCCPSPAP